MKVGIGNDHAGFSYKNSIKAHLAKTGHQVVDFGTNSIDSTDYPDYAHPLASNITQKKINFGILICGSGNGVCMTANKHPETRAALCWNGQVAFLARRHNNANVICIPARFVALELALEMIDVFLSTEFESGRHQRRVEKICI